MSSAVLIGLLAITSAACSLGDPGPKPVSNWTIEAARSFNEFPLYWLGDHYEGLPLATVRLTVDANDVTHASFAYGEPATAEGSIGKHWVPRLEVDIQPYCGYSPEEFLSDDWDKKPVGVKVRGVNGYVRRYSNAEYLVVWTGGSSIFFSTWKSDVDVEDAARALISIAEDSGATPEPLPLAQSTSC